MIDPRIRLRHLRCFLETARLGSLSAAANALNVSQPA
ncbi:LysR family transcriptional regulator [Marivita sp.]